MTFLSGDSISTDFSIGASSSPFGTVDFTIGDAAGLEVTSSAPTLSLGLTQDTFGTSPEITPKSPSLDEMLQGIGAGKKSTTTSSSSTTEDESADKFTRDAKLDYDQKKAVKKDEALRAVLTEGRHAKAGENLKDHKEDTELARETYQAILLRSQILAILAEKLSDEDTDINKWLRAIRHEVNTGKYDKTEADIIEDELKILATAIKTGIEVEERDRDGNRIPLKANGKIKTDESGNVVYKKKKISGNELMHYLNDPAVRAALIERIGTEQEDLGNLEGLDIEKTAAQKSLSRYIALQATYKGSKFLTRQAMSRMPKEFAERIGIGKFKEYVAKRGILDGKTALNSATAAFKTSADEMIDVARQGITQGAVVKKATENGIKKELAEKLVSKAYREVLEEAGEKATKTTISKVLAKQAMTKVAGKLATKATASVAARAALMGTGPIGWAINGAFLLWDVVEFTQDYNKNGISKDSESLIGMGLYWAGQGLGGLANAVVGKKVA